MISSCGLECILMVRLSKDLKAKIVVVKNPRGSAFQYCEYCFVSLVLYSASLMQRVLEKLVLRLS